MARTQRDRKRKPISKARKRTKGNTRKAKPSLNILQGLKMRKRPEDINEWLTMVIILIGVFVFIALLIHARNLTDMDYACDTSGINYKVSRTSGEISHNGKIIEDNFVECQRRTKVVNGTWQYEYVLAEVTRRR